MVDAFFLETSVLTGRTPARRAPFRSHSGQHVCAVFAHAPTTKEYTVPPHLFRVLLLAHLQIHLPGAEATCSGRRAPLDLLDGHRSVHEQDGSGSTLFAPGAWRGSRRGDGAPHVVQAAKVPARPTW